LTKILHQPLSLVDSATEPCQRQIETVNEEVFGTLGKITQMTKVSIRLR